MMKISLVHPDAVVPSRAHADDVGYDLTLISLAKTFDNGVQLYDTGIRVEPPEGCYVEIVPRSSISKSAYMLANSVGVVDPGYRGNLFVALRKMDPAAPDLELPCKFAQLIVRRVETPPIHVVFDADEAAVTARGAGGFGSSDEPKVTR